MSNYQLNFTYQTIYDKALSEIINNCQNCNNYGNINGYLKNENQKWSKQQTWNKRSGTNKATITYSIVNSTRVTQVAESTIRSQFYSYIVDTKKFNLSEQVTTSKLYYFLNCVSAFIETKMRVAGTINFITTAKATVYVSSYNSFPAVTYDVPTDPELIRASDANSVLDVFRNTIVKLIKPTVVKYTPTLS